MASSKFILMERFRRLTSKDFTQVPSDPIELERMEQGRKREDEQRQQIRILFDAIDSDGNKHITTSEMKKYIRDNKPHALAPGISKKILKMADGDGNGQLDFEEFYILTKIPKLNWLFQYVNLVEPPRRGPPDDDEYAEYGAYENMMKCWPLPIMMILFSVLEIAVYLVDENSKWTVKDGNKTSAFLSYYLRYDYNKRNEVWRFVTYMFVHSDRWHLLGNVLFQLFLGIPIEMIHKWRVVIVYLSGVLLGCMGHSIFSHAYLRGASGGVFALVTAHIAIVILNWSQMRLGLVNLFICLVYCITTFISAIIAPEENVSNLTHLFGALAGLLIGIGVLRNLKVESWEKKLWWAAVLLYLVMITAGIVIHVKYFDYVYDFIKKISFK